MSTHLQQGKSRLLGCDTEMHCTVLNCKYIGQDGVAPVRRDAEKFTWGGEFLCHAHWKQLLKLLKAPLPDSTAWFLGR